MDKKGNELLQRAHEARGFHLGVHKIMADTDPNAFEQYQIFIESAYTNEGKDDRKTKEFLHIAVNIALAEMFWTMGFAIYNVIQKHVSTMAETVNKKILI